MSVRDRHVGSFDFDTLKGGSSSVSGEPVDWLDRTMDAGISARLRASEIEDRSHPQIEPTAQDGARRCTTMYAIRPPQSGDQLDGVPW